MRPINANPLRPRRSWWLAALLVSAQALTGRADMVNFSEFDGLANNAPIPETPYGVPEAATSVWRGLLLHTVAGNPPLADAQDQRERHRGLRSPVHQR